MRIYVVGWLVGTGTACGNNTFADDPFYKRLSQWWRQQGKAKCVRDEAGRIARDLEQDSAGFAKVDRVEVLPVNDRRVVEARR